MISTPTRENLHQAAEIIKTGGLIAYPTETVYGLGADPHNPQAVSKIFEAKGREETKGIILLIPNRDHLPKLVQSVTPTAEILVNAFWPGALTLIFQAHSDLSPALLGGQNTVALRHSSSPIATQLLTALNGPLTSTSANRSGNPPCRSAAEVQAELGDHLDLILDDGPSPDIQPSTLVDVSTNQIRLLREGAVSAETLRKHVDI